MGVGVPSGGARGAIGPNTPPGPPQVRRGPREKPPLPIDRRRIRSGGHALAPESSARQTIANTAQSVIPAIPVCRSVLLRMGRRNPTHSSRCNPPSEHARPDILGGDANGRHCPKKECPGPHRCSGPSTQPQPARARESLLRQLFFSVRGKRRSRSRPVPGTRKNRPTGDRPGWFHSMPTKRSASSAGARRSPRLRCVRTRDGVSGVGGKPGNVPAAG